MGARVVAVRSNQPDGPSRQEAPVHAVLRQLTRPVWRLASSFRAIGLVGALCFLCLTFLPALIPRPLVHQAVFSGLTAALGYGFGLLLAWFGRRAGIHPDWADRTRRMGWFILAGAAALAITGFMFWSFSWQAEARRLLGMAEIGPSFIAALPLALVTALILVLLARAVRVFAQRCLTVLKRWVPLTVFRLVTWVGVAAVAVLVLNGTAMSWLITGMEKIAIAADRRGDPDLVQPVLAERSGSPESLVSWDSLGRFGRQFVSGGPSTAQLADFASRRATPPEADVEVPIRVYAPLGAADSPTVGAELAVAELDRTGAWDRAVLVVAAPASSGLVDPAAVETIELMHGGNTAVAALQYSELPSWIAFLADRHGAPEAGQALFEAVYAAWSERPEAERPLLLMYGESLGSFSGHGAFSGLQDMVVRTDGALWVATPWGTEILRDLTENRDAGSYERHPVYEDGRQVRWASGTGAADLWELGPRWEFPRVAYIQHASDAVVWWSSDLLLHEPDWMREPAGVDVLPGLQWLPVVTFWHVTMDLFLAGDVPAGYGHNYLLEYVDGWSAVAPPDDWSDHDAGMLREVIDERFADMY
ncbi:alpha/beta hydrolase [Phytoactinopolyspora mesophila]|uniref:Alpha/beta-hydrolase family protein n=1 Tax=Phytoactinopolyspora mesophila TaxID=2650750 RepID=A0A7K3MD47_9ACTN|nr:alpha/beta hydrolase [Phytoactinopolyspora mesophila]NDL60912.1 hypothetical protein [Phytoactinopolyspora mesophila]